MSYQFIAIENITPENKLTLEQFAQTFAEEYKAKNTPPMLQKDLRAMAKEYLYHTTIYMPEELEYFLRCVECRISFYMPIGESIIS